MSRFEQFEEIVCFLQKRLSEPSFSKVGLIIGPHGVHFSVILSRLIIIKIGLDQPVFKEHLVVFIGVAYLVVFRMVIVLKGLVFLDSFSVENIEKIVFYSFLSAYWVALLFKIKANRYLWLVFYSCLQYSTTLFLFSLLAERLSR